MKYNVQILYIVKEKVLTFVQKFEISFKMLSI